MFRITKDPSSGSDILYLIEITCNGSQIFIMCVVGVCDPKHVGVIFNYVSFKLLYYIDFNIYFCITECISRLIKVTDRNNAQWKLEMN